MLYCRTSLKVNKQTELSSEHRLLGVDEVELFIFTKQREQSTLRLHLLVKMA